MTSNDKSTQANDVLIDESNPDILRQKILSTNVGNDQIIAAYLNPLVKPWTDVNNMMIVGTGGVGLWERSWRNVALGNSDEDESWIASEFRLLKEDISRPGIMRAMSFACDIAKHYEPVLHSREMEHYKLTPEGIEQRESFIKHIAKLSETENELPSVASVRERLEPKESSVSRFIEKHPDGHQRFRALEFVCRDALQLGKHITFLGIFHCDEDMLANGRTIMKKAIGDLDESLDSDHSEFHRLASLQRSSIWPGIGVDVEQTAIFAMEYVAAMLDRYQEECAGQMEEASRFIAEAVVARNASEINNRDIGYLHDLGAKDGGIASAMRDIDDAIFRNKTHGITDYAIDKLAHHDATQSQAAYMIMADIQQIIIAVAFAYLDAPDGVMEKLQHISELRNGKDNPDEIAAYIRGIRESVPDVVESRTASGYMINEIRKRAVANLEIAERAVLPVYANRWQDGDFTPGSANHFYYHFRHGAVLSGISGDDCIEDCVKAARNHPKWQPFLDRRLRFRQYD